MIKTVKYYCNDVNSALGYLIEGYNKVLSNVPNCAIATTALIEAAHIVRFALENAGNVRDIEFSIDQLGATYLGIGAMEAARDEGIFIIGCVGVRPDYASCGGYVIRVNYRYDY